MPSPYCPDTGRVTTRGRHSNFESVPRKTSLTHALAAAAALMFAAAGPAARADNGVGAWTPPVSWPLVAIHTVLMPDGRVLTYGSTATGQQTASTIYDVWDPSAGTGAGHMTLPNNTGTDIFCSSMLLLPPSGNVFIV